MNSESLNDLIHCHKCKKKTKNIDSKIVQTNNGLHRIAAKCSICKTIKSKFIKKPREDTRSNTKKELSQKEPIIEANDTSYAPVRKKFPKRKIITLGIDNLWAADLATMTNYSYQNDNYKYMLNVIDTFSKYAWSRPLKKKNLVDVTKAFEEIINDAIKIGHKSPNLLHTDEGLEFKN